MSADVVVEFDPLFVWEDCQPWLCPNGKADAADNIARDIIMHARLQGGRPKRVAFAGWLRDGGIICGFHAA